MSRAVILMYHSISYPYSSQEAKYCCPPENFARQMRYLREFHYQLISLDKLVDCLESGESFPENSAVVTFDDGFADMYEYAMPVICQYEIPATLFMVASYVDGSNEWIYQDSFSRRRFLSKNELRELSSAGICIGSHTCTHPRLTELSKDDIEREVKISKSMLQDMLGKEVCYFAYPHGLYNELIVQEIGYAGYRAACTTRSGFNRPNVDRFALRRIEINGSDSLWKFQQKLEFSANQVTITQCTVYYLRRLFSLS